MRGKHSNAFRGAICLGAVIALALTGCDGGTEPTEERTTLEIGTIAEPPTLNPVGEQNGGVAQVINTFLMPLMFINPDLEIYSEVLEEWELSADGLSATLRVAPDLQWSDDEPITSADVVTTLELFLDSSISPRAGLLGGVTGQAAFSAGESDTITGITAPDDRTVVVAFDQPNVSWFATLSTQEGLVVLPAHILGDVPHDEILNHEYFRTFPVVNGPYRFIEWATGQHVELARNDSWSLGTAAFEQAFIKYLDVDVAAAQLETGESQMAFIGSVADASRLRDGGEVEISQAPRVGAAAWGLRYEEPLLDVRVRQAMAYAVDRAEICRVAQEGFCTAQTANIPQIGPSWAIPDDVMEFPYNPDRARELLAEAGWDSSTELEFLAFAEPGSATATAIEIVQAQLADVGINWRIVSLDAPTFVERIESDSDSFDGYWRTGGNVASDPRVQTVLHGCGSAPPNGLNMGRFCDPEIDALLAEGDVEVDPDRRAEIYQEALQLLNDAVPAIMMPDADLLVGHDLRLTGVRSHPMWGGLTWNIGHWGWEG